ncbi:hypothetical protein MLD38_021639 [Melastoma candidum]|uniref:Uncharacterized protein n=1 Tax=Melastoma candidum TaxID=119954 RepID=A0ACB9QK38_9MYRT|nr:hypothetical protein MLD38_021639 [Melastoma candidum]
MKSRKISPILASVQSPPPSVSTADSTTLTLPGFRHPSASASASLTLRDRNCQSGTISWVLEHILRPCPENPTPVKVVYLV